MIFVLKQQGFYPFGDKTLFIMDMKKEDLPFFAYLRYVIKGDESLFFSWSRSLGGNLMGLVAYYIASPLSFVTAFFKLKDMPMAILTLMLLKFGLCGVTFSVFASYIWRKNKLPYDNNMIVVLLPISICYALMSYNISYSLELMWTDGVILLPIILMGIEKILEGKRAYCYILSLAMLFISNYYIGYMVGIFTALYLLYRLLCLATRNSFKNYVFALFKVVCGTILAIGLSAPLLLPAISDLFSGRWAAGKLKMPNSIFNFSVWQLFGRMLNGAYDSIKNGGTPSIYCGYLVTVLAIVFILAKGITLKEKIGAIGILLILALSFYIAILDIAWHGFQPPVWFPYRYSFCFSFFMCYMAVQGLCIMFKNNRVVYIIGIFLLAVACIDMGFNANTIFKGLHDEFSDWQNEFGYSTIDEWRNFLDSTQPLVEDIKKNDSSFYRINQGYEYSKSDGMMLGYNGLSHYSSTYNGDVNALVASLGFAQSHTWNTGYGSTPLTDCLFGVKYILDDSPVPSVYIKLREFVPGVASYQNVDALSIAYGASVNTLQPDLTSENPFENQNRYINAITEKDEEYFEEYEYVTDIVEKGWTYRFTVNSGNPVYLYMPKLDTYIKADVYVNDQWVGNYFTRESNCILYLGTFDEGEQVAVTIILPEFMVYNGESIIAQLNMDLLENTLKELSLHEMKINKYQSSYLSGTIHLENGQKIVTSIPFDKGWTVKVDGQKVDVEKFADTFIAFDASEGEHEISFSYVPPMSIIGGIIGGLTMLLLIGLWRNVFEKGNNHKGRIIEK